MGFNFSSYQAPGGAALFKNTQYVSGTYSGSGGTVTVDGVTGVNYQDVAISALSDYTKAVFTAQAIQSAGSNTRIGLSGEFTSNTNLRLYGPSTVPLGYNVWLGEIADPSYTLYKALKAYTAAETGQKTVVLSSNTNKQKIMFGPNIAAHCASTDSRSVPKMFYDQSIDTIVIERGLASIRAVGILYVLQGPYNGV